MTHGTETAGNPAWTRLGGALRTRFNDRLLRNILTVVCGTAGAQVIGMALMPVITRLYGPEAYGLLGVFMGLVAVLVPIAALTYPIAIVLPERDADARGIAHLSLKVAATLSILCAVLLGCFGEALAERLDIARIAPFLMLLPLVMFAGAVLEVLQQWLIRTQRFGLNAKMAIRHALLHNGLRIGAGLVHASPAVLLISTALGPPLQATMLALGLRHAAGQATSARAPGNEATPGSLDLARRYRDFPLLRSPLILLNTASQTLPILVLASFFGPIAAGFFTLCRQALSMPTNLIGKSVADVYYPKIAQAVQRGEAVTAMLARATAALALLGLLPFALVFFAGPTLFAVVFGPDWQVAGEYARWLALAEYCVFISRPSAVAVPALSLQGRFLLFEVLSTALRIGALLAGALLLEQARLTVLAFSLTSILIYLSLIVIVLVESRRWHTRLQAPR